MEYSFIDKDKLKYLYENKLIPNGLMAYNHSWNNKDVKEIYSYLCHSSTNPKKIFGLCVGVVYNPNTINKCSQWIFGENRHRELWIEHIHVDPESCCKGSYLLDKVEEKLRQYENVERKNIYVLSIFEAVNFYEKCGYNEIQTNDTNEDEDYPSAYVNGTGVGTWMAKPLQEKLDSEDFPGFMSEYLFNDAWRRHSTKMIQKYLTIKIELDIFWFLFPTNFDKFKTVCGRKYTNYSEEKFIEEKYPKYSDFLKSIDIYEKTKDLMNVKSFFKEVDENSLSEMLDNYFDLR